MESRNGTLTWRCSINTITDKDQISPAAAMDANGNFVIAWEIGGQSGSGSDIKAQQFNAAGMANPNGEFLVNETTAEGQRSPAVGMDGNGNFLVTWQSSHQDGFSWGIYGREYAANGNTVEHEFLVNTRVQGPQTNPAVGVNSQGNAVVVWLGLDANHTPAVQAQRYQFPMMMMMNPPFTVGGEIVLANFVALEEAPPSAAMDAARNSIVVWESYEDTGDYSGLGIFGRRVDRNGNPLGDAFLVNTTTLNNQSHPDVASDANGNFVVVWEADDQDGSGHGIFAQRFDSTGNKIGGEFQVNTTTAGDQGFPSVAMDAKGDFVVAWQGPDADGKGIFAQRFDAQGQPVGSEFPVNAETALDQFSPDVAINEKGQFVIAWVSDHLAVTNPDLRDTEKSIFVQWYDSDGSSTGEEVLVHSLNPAYDAQEAPAVAINQQGDFTVVFQSINQDGNSWGVFARQFLADKTPVQPMEFQVNETTQGPQRYPGDCDGSGREFRRQLAKQSSG